MNPETKKKVGLGVVAVVVLLVGGFLTYKLKDRLQNGASQAQQAAEETVDIGLPIEPAVTSTPLDTIERDVLRWQTYTSLKNGFTIKYPEQFQVTDEFHKVQFKFFGPTQLADGEITDGINFTVFRDQFHRSFIDYVNSDVQQTENLGRISQPLQEIMIGSVRAHQYAARTATDVVRTFFQYDRDEVIGVSYSIVDPHNIGYRDIADTMLQSILLRK